MHFDSLFWRKTYFLFFFLQFFSNCRVAQDMVSSLFLIYITFFIFSEVLLLWYKACGHLAYIIYLFFTCRPWIIWWYRWTCHNNTSHNSKRCKIFLYFFFCVCVLVSVWITRGSHWFLLFLCISWQGQLLEKEGKGLNRFVMNPVHQSKLMNHWKDQMIV